MKKRIVSAILCAAMVVGIVGCGAGEKSAKTQETDKEQVSGHLVIYTSEPQDLATEMLEDFVAKNPGVTYELYRSGTGDVKTKLSAELDAGGTNANILWFADLSYMYDLDDKGLIMHYSPEKVADIPEEYKYNDGMAHEVRAIYSVLSYNTTQVKDAPKDWADVTGADYKDTLAIANPAYSGGAMTTLSAHVEPANEATVGWDWYQKLADNGVKMEQSNGTLLTKVSSGEYKGAVIVDYLPRNAKAEGSPVDYVYPESGSVLIPTPVCLMNTMPEEDVEAAKAFVDYMFELETQKLFVKQGYVPMISEATEGSEVPTIDDIKVMSMDVNYMRKNSSELLDKFSKMFGTQ